MKLKEFLSLWKGYELIKIMYHSVSNDAYTVKELLSHSEYLEKRIKCSEIRIEKVDNIVAEDSSYRKDLFQRDVELPFICLELCD